MASSSPTTLQRTISRGKEFSSVDSEQTDVQVFVGGIIPENDIPKLLACGVKAVYGPGTPTTRVVEEITQAIIPAA